METTKKLGEVFFYLEGNTEKVFGEEWHSPQRSETLSAYLLTEVRKLLKETKNTEVEYQQYTAYLAEEENNIWNITLEADTEEEEGVELGSSVFTLL